MKACLPGIVVVLLAGCAAAPPQQPPFSVVPQSELERAQQQLAAGPVANRGIKAVKALGTVPLTSELDSGVGRVLRVRELVIEPKGVVGVHEHHQRPGVAYILEGELTEIRSGRVEPITHGVGSVAFEWTGVTHYWENRTKDPARALVVDIIADPGQ